jgi:hypothetical protein
VFGEGLLDGVHNCLALRVKTYAGPKPKRYLSFVLKRASPTVGSVPRAA